MNPAPKPAMPRPHTLPVPRRHTLRRHRQPSPNNKISINRLAAIQIRPDLLPPLPLRLRRRRPRRRPHRVRRAARVPVSFRELAQRVLETDEQRFARFRAQSHVFEVSDAEARGEDAVDLLFAGLGEGHPVAERHVLGEQVVDTVVQRGRQADGARAEERRAVRVGLVEVQGDLEGVADELARGLVVDEWQGVVGGAVGEGAVGGDAEFFAHGVDVWHVDWFGAVGEFFVIQGVAGFPWVWGERPDRGVGGDVVEDDFIVGGHGGCGIDE